MPPVRPRVMEKVRTEPRVWDGHVEPSVEIMLEDQLWLVRDDETGATEDGTPVTVEKVFGPYAADLSTPDGNEESLDDHFQQDVTHSARVAMDEVPTTSDRIRVRERGAREQEFRIVGRTQARDPAWGGTFLWHLDLALLREY